jgi:DUF4097 and DUF4098 domain-containing protein YvlB
MKTFSLICSRRFTCLFAVALALALNSGCVYVQNSSNGGSMADAKAMTNRTVTGDLPANLKSLEIDNRFGFVHVVAADAGSVNWSWKLTVGAPTDTLAAQVADAATCKAVQDGDHLRLVVSLPDKPNSVCYESDLEIQVPKSAAVFARNAFGQIRITGVTGDVTATDQNGPVELRDLGGKVHAQTSFASLTLDGSGPAWLKSQNGSLDARNIRGSLEAETSFDTLSARNVDGPARLRNQNGRIEAVQVRGAADIRTSFATLEAEGIDGRATLVNQNGRVSLKDVKGNADVTTSFDELSANNISGDLTLENQNGRVRVSHVSGSVHAKTSFADMDIEASGRNFTCRNQNGSIRLRVLSPDVAVVDAETSFSSLDVYLPAGMKPAVEARTSFGDIESDFPVLMKPHGQDAFEGIDSTTPKLTLLNQNGRIRITGEKSVAER